MSSRTVKLLALGVVVLFAVVFLMNRGADDTFPTEAGLLLPELEEVLGEVTTVTVTSADGTVTISNENGRWIVPEKHGYPADTAALRSLLLALSDARRIEQKTADPELYDHLGVGDPTDGEGGGVLVKASGGEAAGTVAVILGDSAQGDYRYARLPDEAASWLIDRNPEVPDSVGEWLLQEIVDIPPSDIRSVEIRHADGETVRIGKESADETNFQVADVPDGRELSYPSVANSIAGVLSNLRLEDVRPSAAGGAEPSATVSLATFDGLSIDLAVWREEGESADEGADADTPATWIALEASANEPAEGNDETSPDAAAPEDSGEEPPAAVGTSDAGETVADASATEAGEAGGEPAAGDGETVAETGDLPAEASAADPQEQAAAINERVGGWQYRIPDYKARQLTRRWDDLLQEQE